MAKTSPLQRAADDLAKGGSLTLGSVPDGFDALVMADLARALSRRAPERPAVLVVVARDGQRQAQVENGLAFVAPDLEVLSLPAWDCQPYDRVSPNAAVSARRMTVLSRLARSRSGEERPRILTTTVDAMLQRVPQRRRIAGESFSAAPGNMVDTQALAGWLETNGFLRSSTVRETGEYAVRGGIIDLYAPGMPLPVRLDFFGDTLESIRSFDAETQRTVGQLRSLDLVPMSEVQLTTESIRRFRQAYVARFGATTRDDTLYEAVSEGRRHPGLEHWMPLFNERLDTLFDYLDGAPLVLDGRTDEAAAERLGQVTDYYDARKAALDKGAGTGAPPYKPLPPDALYLTQPQWVVALADASTVRLTPFAQPDAAAVLDLGGRQGRG
ncbi:MAG: transcription-repair coupling factor, partial [Alsobacter sp.]